MAAWRVLMAFTGFVWLTGGLWAVSHPARVDASFSRGTDMFSLPPWTRTVVGAANVIIGLTLVMLSALL